jgi:hypothetical protein
MNDQFSYVFYNYGFFFFFFRIIQLIDRNFFVCLSNEKWGKMYHKMLTFNIVRRKNFFYNNRDYVYGLNE